MKKLLFMLALYSGALITLSHTDIMAQTNQPTPAPPTAKKLAKSQTFHGETLNDDYFWLREKTDKEVISYLEAENAYTDAMMKGSEAFQEKLYQEMLGRIKQTDTNVPYRQDGYYYYSRTETGKQYPIFARKKGSLTAPEEITLDLNELAQGQKYTAINTYVVSDDANLLAYSHDTTGFREYFLRIKDLRTGKLLPDDIGKVTNAFWADAKTLFYITEDAAKRPHRLYRHTLGEPKDKDVLVYEEKDELYRVSARRSRSRQYIFIGASSSNNTEYRYLRADKPGEPFKMIAPREGQHEYYPEHHGELFYIRTNDKGRGFRLVTAPTSDPQPKNWKEILPVRKGVTLEGLTMFANYYVVSERDQGLNKLRVVDLKSGQHHYLEFPEPVYTAFANATPEFDTTILRYGYQSFTTPSSTYDYDMKTRKRELLKQQEVLGGYDATKYAAERVYAVAPDGVRVPVSLYYRKDLRKSGAQPLLLSGYGSYGIPSNPGFSSGRLSLVDRGVIFAIAHIRGGGDLGKEWHDEGKMMKKKNTFTDFIAAAEHLIKEKYTAKDQLVITGGSAGGLLMGAVANMRPDLFKAVVTYVPFVDVINTMMDASLPLTVQEYLEWGNPNEKEAYAYMKSYSPYDNVAAKEYPTMLVKTSLNDSQVMYWEPAKYVAKLRALKTDKNPLLMKINMGAGHGGSSGRYDALRETAFDYVFILQQFGINN
ncbi:MAG TPA: S9 family peptidase [Pyrinomonadaceae bacterium]|nr:S9 family peptidase [Pyrinomonadaceae bacterium]